MSGEDTRICVKVSAPGKVILNGEHSVVYGKLAIAASLDLRTTVIIQEINSDKLKIHLEDLNFKESFNIEDIKNVFKTTPIPNLDKKFDFEHPENLNHEQFIKIFTKNLNITDKYEKNYNSLVAVLYLYFGIIISNEIDILPLKIQVKTSLTIASGTGSSASLMVSLAGSLLQYVKLKKDKTEEKFNEHDLKLIQNWSFWGEHIFHGKPSGLDNTIITFGSVISYRKNRAPIPIKMAPIEAVLIDTKIEKNTKNMVQKVVNLRLRRQKIVDSILDALDSIANDSLEVFMKLESINDNQKEVEECYDDLLELFKLNHNLLNSLNVSHAKLDIATNIFWERNLPCKLTGAGGGGLAIALLRPNASLDDIYPELGRNGLKARKVSLCCQGVRVEL